jgi:ribosome-associated translation inhibitor RaiA
MNVVLKADKEIPQEQVEAARQRVAALASYMKEPPPGGVRVTLRKLNSGRDLAKRPYVADADLRFDGRVLAAHAAGPTPADAAEEVAKRLRRQVRRIVGAEVAQRNEPELDRGHRPEAPLKPPSERRIVQRLTYPDTAKTTDQAVAELLDRDLEFLLFRSAATGEDVVVYRRADGRAGLIHQPGSELANEGPELVVPEPSRYSGPVKLDDARADMDELNARFLYFVDIDDGRGKVLYLRHDGDYGLVEPA